MNVLVNHGALRKSRLYGREDNIGGQSMVSFVGKIFNELISGKSTEPPQKQLPHYLKLIFLLNEDMK